MALSGAQITRLGLAGIPRPKYGPFVSQVITGSGTPQAETATASGVGEIEGAISGSGSPQAARATASGSGTVFSVIEGSGAVQAATATANGAGMVNTEITGSGAVQAETATAKGFDRAPKQSMGWIDETPRPQAKRKKAPQPRDERPAQRRALREQLEAAFADIDTVPQDAAAEIAQEIAPFVAGTAISDIDFDGIVDDTERAERLLELLGVSLADVASAIEDARRREEEAIMLLLLAA